MRPLRQDIGPMQRRRRAEGTIRQIELRCMHPGQASTHLKYSTWYRQDARQHTRRQHDWDGCCSVLPCYCHPAFEMLPRREVAQGEE